MERGNVEISRGLRRAARGRAPERLVVRVEELVLGGHVRLGITRGHRAVVRSIRARPRSPRDFCARPFCDRHSEEVQVTEACVMLFWRLIAHCRLWVLYTYTYCTLELSLFVIIRSTHCTCTLGQLMLMTRLVSIGANNATSNDAAQRTSAILPVENQNLARTPLARDALPASTRGGETTRARPRSRRTSLAPRARTRATRRRRRDRGREEEGTS